ncbi:MAG: type III polyketide synthase, partial [Frankia sp.]
AARPRGRAGGGAGRRDAGVAASELGLLVVVSCTGYGTPGLDIRLTAELGMAPEVRRLVVGHMGCYAAIPGLGAATDFVRARGLPAAVVCVELPSLHIQPPPAERDLEQVVAHGLFGDAAAAIVLEPDAPHGFAVLDTTAATIEATSSLMTWEITDRGFRMGLSPEVPDALAEHVADITAALLKSHGRVIGDVAGWAVHPGGPRVVDVVTERLALPASATAATRLVLDQHGNCSSGTVLLVLAALRESLRPGDDVVAMAFSPGLTLCSALLQNR